MLPFRVFGSPLGSPRPPVLTALVLPFVSDVLARRLSLPKHVTHIKSDFHALPRFLQNAISFLFLTIPPPPGTLRRVLSTLSVRGCRPDPPSPPPRAGNTTLVGMPLPPSPLPPGARGTGSRCSSSSSSAASSPPPPSGPVGRWRGLNPFKLRLCFGPSTERFRKTGHQPIPEPGLETSLESH